MHATSPTTPAGQNFPEYSAMSTADTTYYKWSNDNYVYTELGHQGVIEVDDGYLVFFSGEQPSLDNSQARGILNTARNVGFVKVAKDLSEGKVLSPGKSETGGYFGFNGRWHRQENKGINFLTSLNNAVDKSVSRLKTARLQSDRVLLYWEIWSSTSYEHSQLMVVDDSGAVQTAPWTVHHPLRVAFQDDLHVKDGHAIAYAGAPDGRLIRYEFCLGGDCTLAPTPTSMLTPAPP